MADQQRLRETPWHARPADDAIEELETDPENGLSSEEAEQRLERYGANQIRSGEREPLWRLALRQFTDPLIYILLIAAAVSAVFEEFTDMAVILAAVLINGTIGFYQEWQASKAIASLAEMSAPKATVIRDGSEQEIDSKDVVPGDVVALSSGMRVAADVRLFDVNDLAVIESALTGESQPVSKQQDPVEDEKAVPADQASMAFSGTDVTRGSARGVAVHTGDASELGRIAEATEEAAGVKTPLTEKMDWLGKAIGVAVLALAIIVALAGPFTGMTFDDAVRTAVALAVAAVPESMPIVVTVTLAIGVKRMAGRNAIIRSLPAVETLGSTTVIASDKTGTFTQNEMMVRVIWVGDERFEVSGTGYEPEGDIEHESMGQDEASDAVRMTLLAGLLANEAESIPTEDGGGGDPTEIALLVSAVKAGMDLEETRSEHTLIDTIPFESERQFMATLNETPDGRCVFMKGSPEAVLERCSKRANPQGDAEDLNADEMRDVAGDLADEGYRVLAMAFRFDDLDEFSDSDPGTDFVFAGFQGMEDPVRPEAIDAVKAAHEAGIRVIMLTGDHLRTARAIGEQLGLENDNGRAEEGRSIESASDDELVEMLRHVNIFARVSPEHKLRLVETLKDQGHIVAVTGDGVNDAPALQAAHLGIAMGQAGTDVAKDAAEMVLADDNFASITNAVEEGRVVFSNIRKVTYFLLSTAIGLTLVILSSLVGPWALPFVAAQVLWINLVTTGLQDVALAFEAGEPGLLKEPPRDPEEGVINREVFWRMVWAGIFMAIVTFAMFWWMLETDASIELARSVAMTQMVLLQFFHVFNCRSFRRSAFKISPRDNPYVFGAVAVALLAHLAVLNVGFLQAVFDTEPISLEIWGVIVAAGASIVLAAEIDKAFLRRGKRTEGHEPDSDESDSQEDSRSDSKGEDNSDQSAAQDQADSTEEQGEPDERSNPHA
jgi:magnesium-transporting ATPase (P-type)